MLGPLEFMIRLVIRYGGLISFAVLAAILLWAALALMREQTPAAVKTGWFVCMALCALGLTMCAAEALRGAQQVRAVFAAFGGARPDAPATLGVSNVELDLTDAYGRDPIGVRVWFPQRETHAPRRLLLAASGFGGDRDQIALILAALASEGYIVVAFDDLSHMPAPADESAEQRFLREGPNDYSSARAYAKTLAASETRVDLEASKALRILDRFSRIANAPGAAWGSRVDVSRVGFIGYSFGGAVAAEAAARDHRIGAVVNLDGSLFGQAARDGIVQGPYLLILSDMHFRLPVPHSWRRTVEYMEIDRELDMAAAQAQQPDSEIFEAPLSEHDMFTDAYFNRSHARQWLTVTPMDAHEFVLRRVRNFLARHLPSSDVASQAAAYPGFEKALERRGALA